VEHRRHAEPAIRTKRRRALIKSYEFAAALRAKLREKLNNEHKVTCASQPHSTASTVFAHISRLPASPLELAGAAELLATFWRPSAAYLAC
jgi:hypothetical protein